MKRKDGEVIVFKKYNEEEQVGIVVGNSTESSFYVKRPIYMDMVFVEENEVISSHGIIK